MVYSIWLNNPLNYCTDWCLRIFLGLINTENIRSFMTLLYMSTIFDPHNNCWWNTTPWSGSHVIFGFPVPPPPPPPLRAPSQTLMHNNAYIMPISTVRAEIFAVVLFSRISRVKPLRKFPLQFMSIYSNDNISKIAKLTARELLHLVKTVKINVCENNGVYSIVFCCFFAFVICLFCANFMVLIPPPLFFACQLVPPERKDLNLGEDPPVFACQLKILVPPPHFSVQIVGTCIAQEFCQRHTNSINNTTQAASKWHSEKTNMVMLHSWLPLFSFPCVIWWMIVFPDFMAMCLNGFSLQHNIHSTFYPHMLLWASKKWHLQIPFPCPLGDYFWFTTYCHEKLHYITTKRYLQILFLCPLGNYF